MKFDRLLRAGRRLGFDPSPRATTPASSRDPTAAPRWPRRRRGEGPVLRAAHARPARAGRARCSRSARSPRTTCGRRPRLGLRTADKPDSQDVCFITSHRRPSGVPRRPHAASPPVAWSTPPAARWAGRRRRARHRRAAERPRARRGRRAPLHGGGRSSGRHGHGGEPRRAAEVEHRRWRRWSGRTGRSPGRLTVQCSAHGSTAGGGLVAARPAGRVIVQLEEPQRARARPGRAWSSTRRRGGRRRHRPLRGWARSAGQPVSRRGRAGSRRRRAVPPGAGG